MQTISGQQRLKGRVLSSVTKKPIANAEVYHPQIGTQVITATDGSFLFENVPSGTFQLTVFATDFEILEQIITVTEDTEVQLELKRLSAQLTEVIISQRREKLFALKQLKAVEGTAIYAGKKTEVILMEQAVGNLASNNSRQIFSQVVGLNIYEDFSGGLQLNVGGRGLDPNRSANFNIRQNGYDISADVLGYPESYYSPPAEALSEIQVVRGAASLQYGTQFGGLINFKMQKPVQDKIIALTTRQTLGSFGLFTSFNSLSGTIGKFSYYSYYNYKQGNSFRPNSEFDSQNAYAFLNYDFSKKTAMSFEVSYLKYLAKQPGGLTDTQFNLNPNFSNRTRNWFEVDWKLYALKLEHQFSKKTDFSLNLFALDASRKAVGFRGNPISLNTNPLKDDEVRDNQGNYTVTRDLILGNFNNWGAETRLLSRYNLLNTKAVFLIGAKYYNATNDARQGPGTNTEAPDFTFTNTTFPDYPNQSNFDFPNQNVAIFAEHIFNLSDKLSITPGARLEFIKTASAGTYNSVNFDNANNPISNTSLEDNRTLDRSFLLLGIGASYKPNASLEAYGNISQNYRSVTFSDIRTVSSTFIIDPNIGDEQGYTADFGIRGRWNNTLRYDLSGFGLLYDNRIGIVFDDRANRVRDNVGTAFIYGLETFVDWNVKNTFFDNSDTYRLNWFFNTAITESEYLKSEEVGIAGNNVEFIPLINLKTGIRFGYKNFLSSLQYTYLSKQFTDIENSKVDLPNSLRDGIIGPIPSYDILDLSTSYTYKNFKLEVGINNLLDNSYFTRRATGYPGPGIIPSEPRTFYTTLQFKL